MCVHAVFYCPDIAFIEEVNQKEVRPSAIVRATPCCMLSQLARSEASPVRVVCFFGIRVGKAEDLPIQEVIDEGQPIGNILMWSEERP